ncbi:MAG: response regulator, partial [Thauera sp.]|nr:response regulator [Thauera sp.]
AGMRALVVDDNATNREILLRQLEGWDMRVACAADGAAALEALARAAAAGKGFDIAVLDMHMPHMDGLQLATAIRDNPALAALRLVVLTSSYSSASVRERERAGILRCVHKPIRQAELHEVLCSALRSPLGNTTGAPADKAAALQLAGRVLLAEDNPVNQQVGQAMLQKLGLTVRFADNGEEALRLAAAETFDLILMDCHMPVMDGYEASAAIRALNRTPRVPIVALTANVMEGNRERCLAAGMDDFLAKPYALDQLKSMLQRWMAAAPELEERAPTSDAETRLDDAADALQPAIDRAVIEQFRELDPNGSMALAARILGIYADCSGSVFADIEQSMGNGDSALLRRAAHSLKSSSANVGARQLSALFKEFELLGKENRVDEARAQFDALRAEYARAHEGIRALQLEFES